MANPKIDRIGECTRIRCAEGPHWDTKNQCLYYVDVLSHAFYKYVPETEKITKCALPEGTVSLVIPLEGTSDKFVISHNRKILLITWDGKTSTPSTVEEICEVDTTDAVKTNRFNDGKCDPLGRLYAGTMVVTEKNEDTRKDNASLFLIDLKKKSFTTLLNRITMSNGIAWNVAKRKMYYTDSLTYCVDQFDYDASTGNISNRKTAYDFKKNSIPGVPDGMCIDKEGMLWVACFNGSRVIRIDPDKNQLLRTIPFPAVQITSAVFGGPNLDVLYVTSAALENEAQNPKAGYVYKVTELGGIKGIPGNTAKLL